MTDRRKPQHAGTRQHCSVHRTAPVLTPEERRHYLLGDWSYRAPLHRTAPVVIHLIHAAHGATFDPWTKTVTLHGGPGDERQLMVAGRFWRLLRRH